MSAIKDLLLAIGLNPTLFDWISFVSIILSDSLAVRSLHLFVYSFLSRVTSIENVFHSTLIYSFKYYLFLFRRESDITTMLATLTQSLSISPFLSLLMTFNWFHFSFRLLEIYFHVIIDWLDSTSNQRLIHYFYFLCSSLLYIEFYYIFFHYRDYMRLFLVSYSPSLRSSDVLFSSDHIHSQRKIDTNT